MRCGMHRQLIIRRSEQIFLKYIGHTMRNVELYLMVDILFMGFCRICFVTGKSY